MKNNPQSILKKAENGGSITYGEACILINPELTPLEPLIETADVLTRRSFGNEIEFCAIYPAKVGACSGDCAFCAQSGHSRVRPAPVYADRLDELEIVGNALELWNGGVRHYSLVTSGERLSDSELEHVLRIFRTLKEKTELRLCASLGSLTPERAEKLKQSGVSRYHCNIETCRSYFPEICTTHSYDDKINTVNTARSTGMEICCGCIVGLGETPEQRVETAFELKEINPDSIPVNILNPIPGTRLENRKPPSADEIFRTAAVFRLVMPEKTLRFAGGREKALGNKEHIGYKAGINAVITGNYLTTCGKPHEEQADILKAAGFTVKM